MTVKQVIKENYMSKKITITLTLEQPEDMKQIDTKAIAEAAQNSAQLELCIQIKQQFSDLVSWSVSES